MCSVVYKMRVERALEAAKRSEPRESDGSGRAIFSLPELVEGREKWGWSGQRDGEASAPNRTMVR